VKKEFALEDMGVNVNFTGLCREFGTSAKRCYKRGQRFVNETMRALKNIQKGLLSTAAA
jgi:hypothetical protein